MVFSCSEAAECFRKTHSQVEDWRMSVSEQWLTQIPLCPATQF